jgi:DNA invertase Pin-like site-specific DNA recombinase
LGRCHRCKTAAYGRERIRDVKRHSARQGIYGGGKRPFGFDVVDDRLVPNAEEQAVIANMQARRAAGDSYKKIGAIVGKDQKTVARILARLDRP